jgi:ParB-like chromosome segregation protein Spo0J
MTTTIMGAVGENVSDQPWRNRIIGFDPDADVTQLLANPFNHRLHDAFQQGALRDLLGAIGIVQTVIVNVTTGHMLDGHMRVGEALKAGQATLPVTLVELTEQEERTVLATFDRLGRYAGVDRVLLRDLLDLDAVRVDSPTFAQMFADMEKEARRMMALPPDDSLEAPAPPLFPAARTDRVQALAPATSPENRPQGSGRGNVTLTERDTAPERIALSIVLTKEDAKRWQRLKDELAVKSDTQALLTLLESFLGEIEDQPLIEDDE